MSVGMPPTALSAQPCVRAQRSLSRLPRPGRGLLVGFMLCLSRKASCTAMPSCIASGPRSRRATDKVLYAESRDFYLLNLGNSRADKFFDPNTVVRAAGLPLRGGGINLGLPGADTRVPA